MRTEFIYSVAALASFPIVVNAQVNADNIGKITAKKDGTAWTKNVELARGKYTFKNTVLATGTANKKAKVEVLDGATPLATAVEVKVGEVFTIDFELATTKTVTFKVTNQDNKKDFVADGASVILNFKFTKVAELLKIEYNKVTQVLAEAQYDGKATDAQTYSALYDRIVSIANADYAFYKANTEGLHAIYAGDQTQVSGLTLYNDIVNALTSVKTSEVAYLDGSNGLSGLDARYNSLNNEFGISYVTTALTDSQTAAKSARDAFNSEPTAANLIDAKAKIAAYKAEIEKEEGVKTDNEEANNALKAELDKVYGGATSYYLTSLEQIAAQYVPAARFADLKGEVEAALAAIVGGSDYTDVQTSIHNKYIAKESKEKKNDLINEIAAFKEKLTRVVSDYSTVRGQLAAAYDKYDNEVTNANALTKDAADFLTTYKNDVDIALNAFKSFIEANDQFATVANLTEDAVNAKIADITTAKEAYSAQAAIYKDYTDLKAAVAAQTKAFNDAKTAVDNHAKKDKKLDDTTFKPTIIWASTITAIEGQISATGTNVDNNKTDASNYKTAKEYTDAMAAITTAINKFKANANEATDRYATIAAQIKTAQDLQAALLDPTVDPKVDLTTLNVWSNQVTIDDAIKARTPYKDFINSTDGSITTEVDGWVTKLAAAPSKTAVLNDKGNNKTNILAYLKSLAANASTVLADEITTLNNIKANYTTDEEKFNQQIDQQECAGIITLINDKAVVFEASIKALQDKIDATTPTMSNANKAKLQAEINAITAKIDAAKAVAAKAEPTKAELTAAYNSIKDLAKKDIATAETNATNYEVSFGTSTGFYNTLKGETTDASTVQTLNGLTKKVTEQKDFISGLPKLTDAQKNTLKGKVDAVQVVKKEGTPAADVTYTLTNITTAIETAWQNETLTTAEVSRYQDIISDLKAEIDKVNTQADRLNNLEGQLAAIDFNAAKKAILKKDPNQNGFYVKKLLGNAAAGECTYDFNALKSTIEADEDITADEVTTYEGKISALNTTITDLAALADINLKAWKAVQEYYSKDADPNDDAIWGNGGAVQQYEAAIAKLEADFATSKLEDQKMVLATLKEALDALKNTAEEHYNAGTASAADKTALVDKLTEIKNQWEEYTNEVNYNGQIAADNKAIYDDINAAHAAADAQYTVSSSIINTYKLFKSTELKAAAEKAQTELQDLLTYLEGYDAKVAEIQGRVDDTYGKIVSPEKFDTEETFKAEFEAVEAELKTKTQALSDKIKEYASEPVNASATTYTNAIAASKAKVVKFSATDADLTDVQMDAVFGTIDAMMKAINDNKDNDDKLKDLDAALVVAANSSTGILNSILNAERDQASSALQSVINSYGYSKYNTNLTLFGYGDDYYSFRNIYRDATGYYYYSYDNCVSNFASYKQQLKDLKVKAEQYLADYTAIQNAKTAISNANTALTQLISDYQQFAAGAQVKAAIDQIAAELKAHPAGSVTVANSGEWKTFAEGVYTAATATTAESGRIINVYNDLFDAEVTVIEDLIAQAKEENLTYGGADKATISTRIAAQETSLAAAKEAVAKAPTEAGYKTKKNALLNDLSGIEAVLNADILTMTTGNETNVNDVIMANLNTLKGNLQTRLDNSLNSLDWYSYQDVYGTWHNYTVPTALNTTKSQIQNTIYDLDYYLYIHADEIVAYQANARAMMTDIDAAITKLYSDVSAEKAAQDKTNENNGAYILNNLWASIQNSINNANSEIADLENQLSLYGSASNYANKVSKLKEQTVSAQSLLDNATTAAESKTTMQEKYNVAKYTAEPNVNNALTGVDHNCTDIEALAKQAYIDAFIAKLNAQVIADTWTASANYTNTDKTTLTTMWNDLKSSVTTLKANAEGKDIAQDEKRWSSYDGWYTYEGVITTLTNGEAKFNQDLEALKQALKDMSLVEDVKGYISGNDEISTDDLEALADIILNAQEETADKERCDISGDGEVDVTDLVWLRYFLVHGDWPTVAAAARGDMVSANDHINMEVVSVENNVTRIAINLDNESVFNHFQLNVQLPEGAKVVSQTLGERVEGANLMMAQNGTTVRMLAISTANNVFAGNNGAVAYLDIEGLNGEVNIEKAIFTDTELNGHLLTANSTTSIRENITNALQSAGQKIYNLGGKMMNGLKKGVNIIRNADGSTKKVMK